MLDSHVYDITRVIQLSVAPVFLLTAIGTIINTLTGRFGRAVDRRRVVEQHLLEIEGEDRVALTEELHLLASRTKLVLWSIVFAVISGLLVCLLIGTAFMGAFISLDLARPVAVLFIGSVAALTLCLLLFLREVSLAALSVKHAVRPLYSRGARSQDTANAK